MIERIEIKNRLGVVKYITDNEKYAHITVDTTICEHCPHYFCTYSCPAQCFKIMGGKLVFIYEDCIECGTCAIACDQGAVTWHNPRGPFGVIYKEG
ncbi:MAG: 4Fe-4S binding protein [Candidatus Thermoplasmatota archaeon]|nr:4Fe-4S binding protein [Candidatus Thermoplasmatota archaeon]MCL5963291.1 4Fe-4S binding protein [Candidatus Thermoplasmatota archaeon]